MAVLGAAQELREAARALAPDLRAAADEIDRERRLPRGLMDRMVDAGLVRMLLPRDLGGWQLDPLTAVELVEAVAAANGSAGWVLMVTATYGHWAGAGLPRLVGEQVFGADPRAVMAGSTVPIGRAERVDGGYRLSGRFPFASGSVHATWIASSCFLYEHGQAVTDATGQAVWAAFVTPVSDITLLDTWHSLGLRGTSSHDYTMADVFVADGWQFNHQLNKPRLPDPEYASVSDSVSLMPAVSLGIARAALDAMTALAAEKRSQPGNTLLRDDPYVQAELGRAASLLGAARAYLHQALAEHWSAVQAGATPTRQLRSALRLATAYAVTAAQQVVDAMHALAGSSAVYTSNPIERYFRDVHTAATHVAMRAPQAYVTGGQLLLDLEPRRGYF
jgi:indole-3-acetate monooxygenase